MDKRLPLAPAAAAMALSVLLVGAAPAQSAYKYKDAGGHWVFTDQPPPDGVSSDSFRIIQEEPKLNISAFRNDSKDSVELVALNGCLCTITMHVRVLKSQIPGLPAGTDYRRVIEPRTREVLARLTHPAQKDAALDFAWTASLGSPTAQHRPSMPYRVPFGVGSTYRVTQAFPSELTHKGTDDRYAIDFGLPDGTPVYAARDGLVVNARHDSFKGAADPQMLDQANVVQILHDDGTIAVYAHLHWDSIRVRIGEHVNRGQYIANSGSTGFSSGPHLHFAVTRNTGEEEISVPVQFAGAGGQEISAVDQSNLTAY